MRPESGDEAYLWDMRVASLEVVQFIRDASYEEFVQDLRLRRSVERSIEIVGEAASRVSLQLRQVHSEIPWRLIVAQRNVLAHEYGEIRVDAIWLVASRRIPELLAQLDRLMPEDPTPSGEDSIG